jgi:hypothetical protein
MDVRIVKHPSYSGYTLSPGPAASIKNFHFRRNVAAQDLIKQVKVDGAELLVE